MTQPLPQRLTELTAAPLLRELHLRLGKTGKLHLVGGSVRDCLAAATVNDFDLATALTPAEVATSLDGSGLRVIGTGLAHGTITVLGLDSQAELTTFRRAGPRATAAFSDSIAEDLSGRDFTINALAYSLDEQCLIDPFNGRADLEVAYLRSVGAATERLQEDPLRIMRALRFGPAEGRQVDPALAQACRELAPTLATVSSERIKTELERILLANDPAAALRFARDNEMLAHILPELLPAVACPQNRYHIHDVFEHTLSVVNRSEATKLQRLTALFHDAGKPHTVSTDSSGERHFYNHEQVSQEICRAVLKRLRFSNEDQKNVGTLVAYHMRPLDCGPPAVRRLLRDLGDLLEEWLKFKRADASPTLPAAEFQRQMAHFERLLAAERHRLAGSPYGKLAVNGDDLLELGLVEGPLIGRILRGLEAAVLDDPARNEKAGLLRLAQAMIVAGKENQSNEG